MNSHHDTLNMENNFQPIRGKYKSSIIYNLSNKRKRFTELQRAIGEVSHKVLSEKLKELEKDNLINKEYFYEYPPRVSNKRKRFTELQRAIGEVSHKVLSEKLKELEKDNLINKEYFYEYPPRVEYFLTSKGYEYAKLIKQFEVL